MTMKLVTSCLTNRNRGSRRWAMLSSVPVTRLSMQTTSQPRASRKSQRWEPMNPAPPVTRTRTNTLSEGGYAPLPNLPPGTGCAGKAGARTWNTPTWQAKTLMRHRSDALPPSDWRSASSAGFARATDSWGRLRRGPPRPPPIERRRWALIIALDDVLGPDLGLFPAPGHEVVLDGLRDPLEHEQQESDDDHRLEKEAERNAARVGGPLVDEEGVSHEGPGGVDDHEAGREEEDEREDEVGPGPLAGRPARVEDVHPHVLVEEHGVAGAEEVDHAEQVPLELLGEHAALVERVAHDDVEEHHEDHEEHDPGHAPAEGILETVDLPGQFPQRRCHADLILPTGMCA